MKLAEKLLDIAPSIGTALLGAPGGAIGAAARSVLKKVLGLHTKASDKDIEAKIAAASPNTLLALRKADNDFKLQMKQAEVDLEQIHQQDRDSARKREVSVGGVANPILAVLLLTGFFGVLVCLMFIQLPESINEALLILLGSLATMATQVVNYYFGSSSGSKLKTSLLGNKPS